MNKKLSKFYTTASWEAAPEFGHQVFMN